MDDSCHLQIIICKIIRFINSEFYSGSQKLEKYLVLESGISIEPATRNGVKSRLLLDVERRLHQLVQPLEVLSKLEIGKNQS